MLFNDSTVKIQTRVRSAIGRLRPSKSAAALNTLFKSEAAPPLPLSSVFNQASIETNDTRVVYDLWDTQPTRPVMLKRSDKRLTKRPTGFKSLNNIKNNNCDDPQPTLNSMLEQQGLLDSPISFHITSLITESCDSIDSSSSVSSISFRRNTTNNITRRRSSSDSAYLSRMLYQSSGAATAESVILNTVETSTPELCGTSHLNMVQPQTCVLQTSNTTSELMQELEKNSLCSASSSPDFANDKNRTKKTIFLHYYSPDPSLSPKKLTASPVQYYLKRPGLIPSTQPISDQLLQSFISSEDKFNKNRLSCASASSFDDLQEDISMATITPRSLGLIYNNSHPKDHNQTHLSNVPTIEIDLFC